MRRLQVQLSPEPVMTVHRHVLKKKRLAYLLTAAKPVKYETGRSKIMYIGTTKRGVRRIAGSAAKRSIEIMSTRGLNELNVYVVSCSPRTGVSSWRCLEDALLAEFRYMYDELPKCNANGKKKKWNKKLGGMFKRSAIEKALKPFDASARRRT